MMEDSIGSWYYEPESGELGRCGQAAVRLEPVVARVLDELIAQPGRVLSRATLLDRVWGDRLVVDASVTRAIAALRDVLDDQPPRRFIETLPKRGYRLIASVADCTASPGCARSRGINDVERVSARCFELVVSRSTRSPPEAVIR
jgi:DNA-binding winged helix-turn-helix (wHTH) protein